MVAPSREPLAAPPSPFVFKLCFPAVTSDRPVVSGELRIRGGQAAAAVLAVAVAADLAATPGALAVRDALQSVAPVVNGPLWAELGSVPAVLPG
eukprot:3033196-Alexandrium_andersonii.AAC.1